MSKAKSGARAAAIPGRRGACHRAALAPTRWLIRATMTRLFVMAGLDPAIHVFLAYVRPRRGCPAQGRA